MPTAENAHATIISRDVAFAVVFHGPDPDSDLFNQWRWQVIDLASHAAATGCDIHTVKRDDVHQALRVLVTAFWRWTQTLQIAQTADGLTTPHHGLFPDCLIPTARRVGETALADLVTRLRGPRPAPYTPTAKEHP